MCTKAVETYRKLRLTHDGTRRAGVWQSINLGLTGGSASYCALAGNDDYVHAATSVDQVVAGVNKKTFAVSDLGGFSPPATVTSITADDCGYVALHFNEGFYVYDPHGNLQEDGGGPADFINQRNGWITN